MQIGVKVGHIIDHYKMAKHFEWMIQAGVIRWARRDESNRAEAQLDGILCLLAYYVQWHLRQAWREVLFEDEQLPSDRTVRDSVAPARASTETQQEKAARQTPQGLPLHSFETLLAHLVAQTRNTCRLMLPTTFVQRGWRSFVYLKPLPPHRE